MDEIRILIAGKEVALEFMHRPALAFTMLHFPRLGKGAPSAAACTADRLRQAAPQLEGDRERLIGSRGASAQSAHQSASWR